MLGMQIFRVKVIAILKNDFSYEPDLSGDLYEIFKLLTKTTKKTGGNQYDAAIAYMLMQLEILGSSDETSYNFRYDLVSNACFLSKKAALDITRNTAMELFREYEDNYPSGTTL